LDKEKEKVTNKKEQQTMDGKKVLQANNIIDFHADAQAELNSNSHKRSKLARTDIVKGLAQPHRKIDFLNDQLENSKIELSIFKKNHKSLIEQMLFVQKDFNRRLRFASEEKRKSEDKLKKTIESFRLKEHELVTSEKRLSEMKEKFNKLNNMYSEKVENFKTQYKARMAEKESAFDKKINMISLEKDKLNHSIGLLNETIKEKSSKVNYLEDGIQKFRSKLLTTEKNMQSLELLRERHESVITNLKETLRSVKADYETAVTEKNVVEKELEGMRVELRSTKDSADTSSGKVKSLTEKLNVLQARIVERDEKIGLLEKEINRIKADGVELAQQALEIKEYQITVADMKNELKSLQETRARYERKINAQNTELIELKKNLTEIKLAYENEVEARKNAESKVRELESNRDQGREELSELKLKVADLKKVVELKSSKIEEMNSELDQYESQNEQLSSECASLEEHISSLSAELKTSNEQHHDALDTINGFNEKVAELSAEIMDLKDERDAVASQIKDLHADIESEKQKQLALETELAEKLGELEQANTREADFIEARQNWADTQEAFELRIADFTKLVEEKDQEILAKQIEIEKNIAELKNVHTDLDTAKKETYRLEEERADLIKQQDSLIGKNESLSLTMEQLEVKVRDKDEALNAKQNEIFELESQKSALNEKIESLQSAAKSRDNEQKAFAEGLKDQIEDLKAQKNEAEKKLQDERLKISNLEAAAEAAKLDITRLSKDASEHLDRIERLTDQTHLFDEGKQSLVSTIDAKTREIKDLEKQLAEKTEAVCKLEAAVEEKEHTIEEMQEVFENQEDAQPTDAGLKKRVKALKAKQKEFEEETEKRREELGLYSRWVDSQKESLKKHIVRFSQELKLSLSVNPLKSYLAMTERELEKVNLLLAKPGVVGAQRTHLEEHHKILKDQAGYIAEMVEKNKADVDKRINEVMGLLKQEEFVPVPPLPPKK
jgi:chromosome segregation ATPase